jgi:hypothetical protein
VKNGGDACWKQPHSIVPIWSLPTSAALSLTRLRPSLLSSPYFKFALIAAFISVVLADIAPVAIQVEVGLDPIPASFQVPALPPDSLYSNYSEPFFSTDNRVHASVDIAPVYYNSVGFADTWVKAAPPAFNALAP